MPSDGFVPSAEYRRFSEQNGEDTFLRMNLLYIAFELNELYSEENNQKGEFDELCADILELYLDDAFESFNVVDVADGVQFIITDSNYSISEYTHTYRRDRGKVAEELLAYLQKQRRLAVQNADGSDGEAVAGV